MTPTSSRPSLLPLAQAGYALLQNQDAWLLRRKHRLELLAPGLVRHYVTIDFTVPGDAHRDETSAVDTYWLPLFSLHKAPGRFCRFDLTDGRNNLALPTREENAAYSAALLQVAVEDALSTLEDHGDANSKSRQAIFDDVEYIATRKSQDAQGIVLHRWKSTEDGQPSERTTERTQLRAHIWAHPLAQWLIDTLAYSSLVALPVTGSPGDRFVYRMSYDEVLPDLSLTTAVHAAKPKRRLPYGSGFAALPVTFVIPWAQARSSHFEVHVPDELEITKIGFSASQLERPTHPQHAHTYDTAEPGGHNPQRQRVLTPTVKVRLAKEQYGPFAWGTASVVALLMVLGYIWPEYLIMPQLVPGTTLVVSVTVTPAPSLLLLIPGLVASALARNVHPMSRRLSKLPRFCLAATAAIAFATAVRLALVSSSHPTTPHALGEWFAYSSVIAVGAAGVLVARSIWGWISIRAGAHKPASH